MDYAAHYNKLVERGRQRSLSGYAEKHHIVPRCLGGGNEPENLVRLTPEEHYTAHQLLVKMHPGNIKLLWALSSMTAGNRRMRRANKRYGWLRRRFAQEICEKNRGRVASPETRAKISAAHLGKKRAPITTETRAKMSAASKGRKKSDEHIAKLSAAHIGKKRGPHSVETRAKIAAAGRASALHRSSRPVTEDYRRAQSEKMRAVWSARKAGCSPAIHPNR